MSAPGEVKYAFGERLSLLGPPVVPFYRFFFGEGSPAKIDYRQKITLILTSLLEHRVAKLGKRWGCLNGQGSLCCPSGWIKHRFLFKAGRSVSLGKDMLGESCICKP